MSEGPRGNGHDTLPAGRLEEALADKAPLYSAGDARAEADRCFFCFDAPCIQACPTEIDVPRFIKKISTGDTVGSARTILEANLLGYSCGRVCPVEVLCAGACVYNHTDQPPIAIGRLQRYAVETAFASGRQLLAPKKQRAGKVALVGAGPASLSCAGTLRLEGVEAVIYESNRWPGGLNTTGVAPYKMSAPDSLREVAFLRSLGVQIEIGVTIGEDVSGEELLRGHDAVFLGIGLGGDRRLGVPGEDGDGVVGVPGEDGDGVVGAVALIERLKNDPGFRLPALSRVLVVGGGNTAIDAARELAQLGAKDVALVYRRTRTEMSAYEHELLQAQAEGVRLIEQAVPIEILRENGRLKALRVSGSAPCEAPRSHNDSSNSIAGARDLPADLVVVAIGQSRLSALAQHFPGVAVDDRGCIVVDPATGRTGNAKVYAGGDCANGGKEVVNAVAEGKLAAASILRVLAR